MSFLKKNVKAVSYASCLHLLKNFSLRPFFHLKMTFGFAVAPLIGFFSGHGSIITVYLLRTLFGAFLSPLGISLFNHVPSLMGTLSLASHSRVFKAAIPLLCMILFLVHPVGQASWLYTLYWIPPIVLSFLSARSIFLRALGSTLTTHAVGSTLWLYFHTTDSLFWHGLLEVVWLERLTAALILTAGYYAIELARYALTSHSYKHSWTI